MKTGLVAGAVAALAIGGVALATSRHTSSSIPEPTSAPVVVAAEPSPAPVAVADATETAVPVQDVVYRDRVVYRQAPVRRRVYVHKRSGKHSAMIIAGSTVGGALVGGLVGGKKGAVIGGLVAGGAGTVYDRKTRKRRHVVYR